MVITDKYKEYLFSDRYRWVQHLLFWLVLLAPHLLVYAGITREAPANHLVYVYLLIHALNILLVYYNLYFLAPNFFRKKRYGNYLAYTFISFLVVAFLGNAFLQIVSGTGWLPSPQGFLESLVVSFTLLMTAAAFHIIKRYMATQERLKHLETTSLKTELDLLKNQINPHFLFNALNNIYVQSKVQPAEASESILLLSDLLRYQLYDCTKEKVNLTDEIEYLQNYLEIDKMRKNNLHLDFKVMGSPSGIKVAPYLFIPFVENAVKYGISLNNENKIKILFQIRAEEIDFRIENNKPNVINPKATKGGIGLANISRRLDILYPGQYRLDIEDSYNIYRVRLRIRQVPVPQL